MREDFPMILKAEDIAEVLKVSRPTAYALMKKKGFPLLQLGRSMRVLRDEFFEWLYSSARNG